MFRAPPPAAVNHLDRVALNSKSLFVSFRGPQRIRIARPAIATALLLGAIAVCPSVGSAQAVAGVGDDAIPLPKGGYRWLISGLWNDWDAVYGANGSTRSTPLRGALAQSAVGVATFPVLAPAEAGVRTLTGQNAFALSLGSLDAEGEVRQSIAPLGLSYGISRRLSIRVLVPYVESRDVSSLLINRVGSTANVGENPAFSGASGATARSTNGAVVSQIDVARNRLSTELTRCASSTAANCDAVRSNAAAAAALLARAVSTRNAIVSVYGDATRGGAPVVPINGGAAQTAVRATIATLRADFSAFGIAGIEDGATPAGATNVYGPGALTRIVTDSAWRLGYRRLGNTRRAGIGDIDLTASYLLFDSFRADQPRRLLSGERGVRSMLTGGWRFGTAGADRTEDAFDVPIGEGANAVLLRSTTDVVFSRSLWLSATVRSVTPLADNVTAVLPFGSGVTAFDNIAEGAATRALGTRMDIELAPRYAIGQFFGLSGAYLLRRWGADSYRSVDGPPNALEPSDVTSAPRTMHAAALGASFSTLASYVRGRSRWPAEIIYTHSFPISGSGGMVPAMSTDRLELRIYTGFPRR